MGLEVGLRKRELLDSVAEGKPFWLLNGSGGTRPTSLWALEVDVEVAVGSIGVESWGIVGVESWGIIGVESWGIGEGVMSSAEAAEVVIARTVVLDDGWII